MNMSKVSITAPLVIVLFAYGGYAPGFGPSTAQAQDFSTNYPLESCKSDSQNLELPSSSATVRFEWNPETPSACKLTVRSRGETKYYPFQRADAEFTSMLQEEITMTVHGSPQTEWSITCFFFIDTLTEEFYKLITHDRHSEKVLIAAVECVRNSTGFLLAVGRHINIFYEGDREGNPAMMVDDWDTVILVFKRDSVFEIAQPEPTEIHLFIKSAKRSGRRLIKFYFPNPAQAAALIEFLGGLRPRLNGAARND